MLDKSRRLPRQAAFGDQSGWGAMRGDQAGSRAVGATRPVAGAVGGN